MTIDGTAKVLVSTLVGGFPGLNPHVDAEHAELVVYVGVNPVVSHGHTSALPDPVTKLRVLRSHADVWVIDPRRTETARSATHHLAPRPGTDYAVLAFLVRELLHDAVDRDVLEQRTVDRDALTDAVASFTLEHTARVAGIELSELLQLVEAVRRAGCATVVTGTGVTMSAAGNVTQWLAWVVMILTGAMNRPGGVWFHPGFANQLEAFELPVSSPDRLFGPGPRSRPEAQSFLGEWPCAVLGDEIRAGNIRAVLNLGGHLVTAFPDANHLVPALRSLEVFATIEIIDNETVALSTHVLPTKDQLERADVTLWDFLVPRVAAQHTPAVVDPVGDRRSTWWVLAELACRLGFELADTTGEQATDDARRAKLTARSRCTFDDLVAHGWVETTYDLPAQWVEDHLDRFGGWRPRSPAARRAARHARTTRAARARAAPPGAPSELAAGLPRRDRRGHRPPRRRIAAGAPTASRSSSAARRERWSGSRRWTRPGADGRGVGTARLSERERQPAHVQGRDRPADGYRALLGCAGGSGTAFGVGAAMQERRDARP